MAIKIADEITTPQNLAITDLIATVKSHVSLTKRNTDYFLTSVVWYYANESSVGSANEIFKRHITYQITQGDLDSNLVTVFYSKLKSEYQSTTDV